jgi:hypothetical protein
MLENKLDSSLIPPRKLNNGTVVYAHKDNVLDEKIISCFYGIYPIEKKDNQEGKWFSDVVELKVHDNKKYDFLIIKSNNLNSRKQISIFIQSKNVLESTLFFKKIYELNDTIELTIPLQNIDKIKITTTIYSFEDEKINEDYRKLAFFVKEFIYSKNEVEFKQPIEYLKDVEFDSFEPIKLKNISIFEQNKNVSIVPLKYNERNLYFNSCIFEFKNKKYLLTRHSSFISKNIANNTLKLFDYDTLSEIDLQIKDEVLFEQYEDPRVLVYNNKIYISCVNYIHEKNHLIHQKILVLNENFEHINSIHPVYGHNGKSIIENSGREKNWTYFIYENKLYCVYTIDPHVVIEFDWNGNVVSKYVTYFNCKNIWKYGYCRGGTNPIYKDGYMHSFFHSSIPCNKTRRKYIMGYYKFEAKPPFNIVEINENPILWGNEIDDFILKEINPPVIFPCGAVLDNNQFIISYGVNDEKTGILNYEK